MRRLLASHDLGELAYLAAQLPAADRLGVEGALQMLELERALQYPAITRAFPSRR